ncbi:MAG: hypothetical protein ACEPOV_12715 [Hyphomicrobiales bacterium]
MKHLNIFILIIISIALFSACSRPSEDKGVVIAKAYGSYLYEDDLKHFIPNGASPKDSLIIAKGFINNWIKEKVLLNQAENNLTPDQKKLDKMVEDYKNSLIIYQYENLLVQQKLDTVISNSEIEKYYESNKQNFELKEDIVKFFCVKLNADSEHIGEIKMMLKADDIHTDSLRLYCVNNRLDFMMEENNWTSFHNVLNLVPIKSYNYQAFLKNDKLVEIKDKPYMYIAYFFDFRIKDGVSPLELERQRVVSIILNARKKKLLKDMRENILQEAIKNKDFEVFY